MKGISRKEFIQHSSVAALIAVTGFSFGEKKKMPPLAFSTIATPGWTLQESISYAGDHGFKGIEIRGVHGEMDLLKVDVFSSSEERKKILQLLKKYRVEICNLGSSVNLHYPDEKERANHIATGKKYIDLAEELNCPFIRVFANKFPPEEQKSITIERIGRGLNELGDYAKGKKVTVLMETHGDALHAKDIVAIMKAANNSNVGLIWDICNMWSITKEPISEVFPLIKDYIRHTHIKDANIAADGTVNYVMTGKGQIPIFEAVDALIKSNYKGYYCYEWEVIWHPDLPKAEIALPDYMEAMKKHFNAA